MSNSVVANEGAAGSTAEKVAILEDINKDLDVVLTKMDSIAYWLDLIERRSQSLDMTDVDYYPRLAHEKDYLATLGDSDRTEKEACLTRIKAIKNKRWRSLTRGTCFAFCQKSPACLFGW